MPITRLKKLGISNCISNFGMFSGINLVMSGSFLLHPIHVCIASNICLLSTVPGRPWGELSDIRFNGIAQRSSVLILFGFSLQFILVF